MAYIIGEIEESTLRRRVSRFSLIRRRELPARCGRGVLS